MQRTISVESTEPEFRAYVGQFLHNGAEMTGAGALSAVAEFYQQFAIAGADADSPESDMLLFECGARTSGVGSEASFQPNFTRQFLLEGDEEFYQLKLTLHYPSVANPGGATLWSADYSTVAEWAAAVQATAGYRLAHATAAASYAIGCEMT